MDADKNSCLCEACVTRRILEQGRIEDQKKEAQTFHGPHEDSSLAVLGCECAACGRKRAGREGRRLQAIRKKWMG